MKQSPFARRVRLKVVGLTHGPPESCGRFARNLPPFYPPAPPVLAGKIANSLRKSENPNPATRLASFFCAPIMAGAAWRWILRLEFHPDHPARGRAGSPVAVRSASH